MKFESIIDDFSRNALLGLMETEALRLIAFSTDLRSLSAGEAVYRVGEAANAAWFIHAGTVSVNAGGTIQSFGPGALLGENALLVDSTRPATAIAEDAIDIRAIPRDLVRRVLSEFPDSAKAVLGYLTERATEFRADLSRLYAVLPDDA